MSVETKLILGTGFRLFYSLNKAMSKADLRIIATKNGFGPKPIAQANSEDCYATDLLGQLTHLYQKCIFS